MAPSKTAKKTAKSPATGKTARKSTGGKGKTSGKTAADKTPAGRTTRSGGGTYATGGKSLPKKTTGKKTTGGKKKTRASDTASRSDGTSIHKTGSRWGNHPGTIGDSQAVAISQGSPQDLEFDEDWLLDGTLDALKEEGGAELKNVKYTPSLKVQLSLREESNRSESIQFAIGDKIWVLPDKASSTIPKNCGKIEDLPDEFWWVAEVVNCCYLKTPPADSQGDVSPFGFLEVVWFYSYDHASDLVPGNLHKSYLNRVKEYKLQKNERIISDHHDFIPLSSYAGFADDIFAHLELHGLSMSAKDRLKDVKDRPKRKSKDLVWISGFENRKKKKELFSTPEAEAKALGLGLIPKPKEQEHPEKASKGKRRRGGRDDEEEEDDPERRDLSEDDEVTQAQRSRPSSSKKRKKSRR